MTYDPTQSTLSCGSVPNTVTLLSSTDCRCTCFGCTNMNPSTINVTVSFNGGSLGGTSGSIPLKWNGLGWFGSDPNFLSVGVCVTVGCQLAGGSPQLIVCTEDVTGACVEDECCPSSVNGQSPDSFSCNPFMATWSNVSFSFSPNTCTPNWDSVVLTP